MGRHTVHYDKFVFCNTFWCRTLKRQLERWSVRMSHALTAVTAPARPRQTGWSHGLLALSRKSPLACRNAECGPGSLAVRLGIKIPPFFHVQPRLAQVHLGLPVRQIFEIKGDKTGPLKSRPVNLSRRTSLLGLARQPPVERLSSISPRVGGWSNSLRGLCRSTCF